MKNNTRHRRYLLTINNPGEEWSHEKIREVLNGLKLKYWCMSDEIGQEGGTYHTHVYFVSQTSAIRFSSLKGLFPTAHIDPAKGTSAECRAYVEKSGKWTEKAQTSVAGTFEEFGECPIEHPGERSDIAEIYRQIDEGMSNAEIMAANPDTAMHIGKMDKIRQDILESRYREQWRDLDVTYIFGPTGTGKTRGVMEAHGYANVYRVTDYSHPFDRYSQEPVLCLDEFRSSIMVGEMLDYLDGYPLALPARYANRQACYETVYIVSNIDLRDQYPGIQQNEPQTWKAFLRRIHHVIEYSKDGLPVEHGNATEYIYSPSAPDPDWVTEAEQAEQGELPLF